MKKKLEEQVVQEFPYRCPYCDQIVSYKKYDLKSGENVIKCPSCKGEYIKVVSDISPPPLPTGRQAHPPPSRGRGREVPSRGRKKIKENKK